MAAGISEGFAWRACFASPYRMLEINAYNMYRHSNANALGKEEFFIKSNTFLACNS